MLSTLTWIWKTFLSAQKDCYISFPTWVWRRVRPRIQRICPDLTSWNVETLVLWQTTTNRFRGILKIKQLPANHWVVGVMTGMVGVAGKEEDENESSTFFSTWPALESLKKMNMILLLFFILACSRVTASCSHLGAGSSRWGESGSGGCVPTLEQTPD